MPTTIDKQECDRRIAASWDDLPNRPDLRAFKWHERSWFADTRHGTLCMAEIDRDRETHEILGIRETRPKYDRQVDFFDYEQTKEIYGICRDHDCTIMEAVISFVGEDNLPDAWVQRALKAPRVKYKKAKSYEAENKKKDEPVVFVDPRRAKDTTVPMAAPEKKASKGL